MKNNFLKRSATSAVFVIVLIGCILWHPISFFALFFTIVLLGLIEFYRINIFGQHKPQVFSGIALGLMIFTVIFLLAANKIESNTLLFLIPLIVIICIIELFRNQESPFENVSLTLFGAAYIAVPFGLLSYFVFNSKFGFEYNASILITYFSLIWVNDSGAYIIGSRIGKNRLFERISPKKSWEGFIGGAVFALLAAYVASLIVNQIDLFDWMVISIITVTFGTLGDLFESLLKRSTNIKDSGNILPGHGGILDRFDSLLLSAPIVFVYLMIFA